MAISHVVEAALAVQGQDWGQRDRGTRANQGLRPQGRLLRWDFVLFLDFFFQKAGVTKIGRKTIFQPLVLFASQMATTARAGPVQRWGPGLGFLCLGEDVSTLLPALEV